jgi:hypothetical protein
MQSMPSYVCCLVKLFACCTLPHNTVSICAPAPPPPLPRHGLPTLLHLQLLEGCAYLQKLPTIIAAALLPVAAACGSFWEAAKVSLGMSNAALSAACLVALAASICAVQAGLAAYKVRRFASFMMPPI